jgi:hypothetical protein
MYRNLKQKNLGGFSGGWYWSSSQYNSYAVYMQRFSDGEQNGYYENTKRNTNQVRACRWLGAGGIRDGGVL